MLIVVVPHKLGSAGSQAIYSSRLLALRRVKRMDIEEAASYAITDKLALNCWER